ncbi:MAG: anthranilate synthase component I family protein [Pseudomonadota bacterium]
MNERVRIWQEIPWRSPLEAFAPFAGEPGAHLLHGGEKARGGWSILAAFPAARLTLTETSPQAWLQELDGMLADRRCCPDAPGPFASGVIGYVGYEALSALEPSLQLPLSPHLLPAAHFDFYDAAIVFDRRQQRTYVSARNENAKERLMAALQASLKDEKQNPEFHSLSSNFTRSSYENAVWELIERIRAGAFFQTNLSHSLTALTDQSFSGFSLYKRLAEVSDAQFSAFLQYTEGDIISNSPERFFQISQDGVILTEPIKGTRPRSAEAEEDMRLAEELSVDEKERAENIMIADLMRNDLSKICEDDTISEDAICELVTFSRVHHLVSRISGKLKQGCAISNIFAALFPSGSITGAPKIEAMSAISDMEKRGRGPYCGAIGYIDDNGCADFSVAIRTLITNAARTQITAPVGGGVTLRSNPSSEYNETLVKAAAACSALGLTPEGLQ